MDFDNDFYNVYENDPHFRQYYVIEKDCENNFFFRLFYFNEKVRKQNIFDTILNQKKNICLE